jgi:hypothetical protein
MKDFDFWNAFCMNFLSKRGKEIMTVGNQQISAVTGPEYRTGSGKNSAESLAGPSGEFSARLSAVQAEIAGSGKNEASSPVFLGRLTREAPTVSHLLVQGHYRSMCWDILSEAVNADKPFTRIPEGEAIFMDPDTREILWGRDAAGLEAAGPDGTSGWDNPSGPVETAGPGSPYPPKTGFSAASLDAAAARFMGTAYERMNCYELVVAGLETMGIEYRGQNGLGRYLVDRAVNDGMAVNHHLTGEGVTRAIGRDLHVTTFHRIDQVDAAVDKAMQELSGKLAPGQILSFSTPTRGHTGIVSRKGDTWTFINAGVMDNPVAGGTRGKAVGEEHLAAEIRNWVNRAHREGAGLHITLGTPDPARLARFQSGDDFRFSSRA